jgi:hypothetical protein
MRRKLNYGKPIREAVPKRNCLLYFRWYPIAWFMETGICKVKNTY